MGQRLLYTITLTGESDDSGLPPEPPEKQKKLLAEANSLSDAELEKALEYIQFLKSQRKGWVYVWI